MPKIIECGYCGKPAKIEKGVVLYGKEHKLAKNLFYACAPCGAWVGMHASSKEPFGSLAKADLRRKRLIAHNMFDPFWKIPVSKGVLNKRDARLLAYKWLAEKLDIPALDCHIGMFDIGTCNQVIGICHAVEDQDFIIELAKGLEP